MTDAEIRVVVLRLLGEIAPEADLDALDADGRVRDQIDIDSMDALNFLIAVDKELGVDIPEADYPRLATLNAIVAYISEKLASR